MTYECDVCGRTKREANHWWTIRETPIDKGFHLKAFDPSEEIFVCGGACLHRKITEYTTRVLEREREAEQYAIRVLEREREAELKALVEAIPPEDMHPPEPPEDNAEEIPPEDLPF
jgi:hypothetical protein